MSSGCERIVPATGCILKSLKVHLTDNIPGREGSRDTYFCIGTLIVACTHEVGHASRYLTMNP